MGLLNRIFRRNKPDAPCIASNAPLRLVTGTPDLPGFSWRPYTHEILGQTLAPGPWTHEREDDTDHFYDEDLEFVLRFQHQHNVRATSRVPYTESFIEANIRDAPGYKTQGPEYGNLGPYPSARVEGRFDNGIDFYTRSYVLFTNNAAVMIMGRAPYAEGFKIAQIIDAIVTALSPHEHAAPHESPHR